MEPEKVRKGSGSTFDETGLKEKLDRVHLDAGKRLAPEEWSLWEGTRKHFLLLDVLGVGPSVGLWDPLLDRDWSVLIPDDALFGSRPTGLRGQGLRFFVPKVPAKGGVTAVEAAAEMLRGQQSLASVQENGRRTISPLRIGFWRPPHREDDWRRGGDD